MGPRRVVKAPGLRIIDLRADQIGREQIGGELQAGELDVDGRGEGLDRERLGQAGHALQQNVSVGQQADDQPFRPGNSGR